jgi:hypothetical protein
MAVAGLVWADPSPINADPYPINKVTRLPLAPSFEEDGRTNAPFPYLWRSSRVLAGFAKGGRVEIGSENGGNLRISLAGANAASEPKGEQPSGTRTLYYLGKSSDWHSDAHFQRIRYREIYRGIDVVFFTTGGQLEFNFEIAPGANPGVIRIRYDGAKPSLVPGGRLEFGGDKFKVVQRRPRAFERRQGRLVRIRCQYRVSGRMVSVALGNYDQTASLVIDPVLIFSTYLGGSGFDSINGATADAAGNLYFAGATSSGSLTNPSTPVRSSNDAFVAKLNSTATQVLYLIYLGGSGNDSANSVAVDSSGNAYVTGVTASSNFPVTRGALTQTEAGLEDAFVAKLNSKGQLQYSTYLGGSTSDYGLSIAVDGTGAVYVAGQTTSSNFPITTGAFETTYQGGVSDCFVSKLNSAGSALVYSTLVGGSGLDLCSGIAVDATDQAYVTGTTYSPNFPLQGAIETSLAGSASAFVAKINPSGTALVYSSYLGGSGTDNGNAIAVDSSGSAYVAGNTSSVDFPVTPGVFQSALKGIYNAFVVKLSPSGGSLVYATLLGGTSTDTARSVAVDPSGRAILGGYTDSVNFPVVSAVQAALGGNYDAFATVVDPAGATLVLSTYLGGSGEDLALAVVPAPGSVLFLAGMTDSNNFPLKSALQASPSLPPDAFLSEMSYAALAPVSVSPSSGTGSSQTFAFLFSDSAGASDITVIQVGFNTVAAGTNSCFVFFTAATHLIYLATNSGAFQGGVALGTSTTLQNSQCSLNVAASSVSLSGNNLTLNLALSFKPSFAGTQNIYMYVQNATVASGFTQEGTWTVPAAVSGPLPVSVTPNSGTGSSQTFAFLFSDPAGASDITVVQLGFNTAVSGTNSCFVFFTAATHLIYLASNAGAFQGGVVLGTSTTLQNSQCSVNVAASSVSLSGNNLTLNLALSFSPAFAGAQNIYMYVQNATVANGFTQEGTWTVPAAASGPLPVSVTPSSGNGSSQTFAFLFSDPAGASDITVIQLGFNTAVAGTNSCFVFFTAATHLIYLATNAGAFQGGVALGTSTTLQNSQCSVNVAASSVSLSGNNLTLNLALSFSLSFAGTQNIYMYVQNATIANGFTQEGTWKVPAAVSGPLPVSVTPSSGTGSSQAFAFLFSDPAGASDITVIQLGFNTAVAGTNSCFVFFTAATHLIYLATNAGAFQGGVALGTSTTLQNSQCSVNVAASSVSLSGNNLTLNLALSFSPAFAGPQNIYMYVQNATIANGFTQEGTWKVP